MIFHTRSCGSHRTRPTTAPGHPMDSPSSRSSPRRSQSPLTDSPRARSPRPLSPRPHDFAASGCSSSLFSQQGESYATQRVSAIGSPGTHAERFVEGPALYINGPPNAGTKTTLHMGLRQSPRGRFPMGPPHRPAQFTVQAASLRSPCQRSSVGPDPYHVATARSKPPTLRPAGGRFTAETSARQPFSLGRTAALAFDPYHVASRNEWIRSSTSIRSILASPMPGTPGGSPYLPKVSRGQAPVYRSMRPSTAGHDGLLPMPPRSFFTEGRSPFS